MKRLVHVRRPCGVMGIRLLSSVVEAWPKAGSPEWLALKKRPRKEKIPVDVAMGYKGAALGTLGAVSRGQEMTFSLPKITVPPTEKEKDKEKAQQQQHAHHHQPGETTPPPPQQQQQRKAVPAPLSRSAKRLMEFRMTPREVKGILDERVVGQHAAKKAIAVAISEHYHHARRCLEDPSLAERHFHKPNMLLFGPSGSGKSHLMRAAASIAGAPFVKADATKFSATGYVGGDVADVVDQLLEAADHDASTARFGLVYVDEIDKVCCAKKDGLLGGQAGSVNTRDVQTALLKLMEDFEVRLNPPKQPFGTSTISQKPPRLFSTKFVLFVFAGAFEKALPASSPPTAQDFVDVGLIREFVGRIPVRVALEPLSVSDLVDILKTSNDVSPLSRYASTFANHGIHLTFADDALHLIAERAHEHGLGARGLLTEVEHTLREFAYHLPSCSLDRFHLDKQTVLDPHATLDHILQHHDLDGPLCDDHHKPVVDASDNEFSAESSPSSLEAAPKHHHQAESHHSPSSTR
mmetsp:Transcript_13058/g.42569  ORF Transcript_13058/g.42569 Transcript_13058/m.42569 type:complete len:521 (-) Transcript_13058:85-1647(-)